MLANSNLLSLESHPSARTQRCNRQSGIKFDSASQVFALTHNSSDNAITHPNFQGMLTRLQDIFQATCQKWRSTLTDFNGEDNHVHLLISYPPDVAVSKLVNNLKTVSSRLIRKECADEINAVYKKAVFWSGAYFVASCGGVTVDQLQAYVETQDSPVD
jgi:putative transposase